MNISTGFETVGIQINGVHKEVAVLQKNNKNNNI